MSKTQKFLSYSFFGIITFAFFMSFVNDLTTINEVTQLFEVIDETW